MISVPAGKTSLTASQLAVSPSTSARTSAKSRMYSACSPLSVVKSGTDTLPDRIIAISAINQCGRFLDNRAMFVPLPNLFSNHVPAALICSNPCCQLYSVKTSPRRSRSQTRSGCAAAFSSIRFPRVFLFTFSLWSDAIVWSSCESRRQDPSSPSEPVKSGCCRSNSDDQRSHSS